MPEQPEAAIYVRQITSDLIGAQLHSCKDERSGLHVKLQHCELRGKRIVLAFSDGHVDIIELSLTGYLCMKQPREQQHRIVKVWPFNFNSNNDNKSKHLLLVDSSTSVEFAKVHEFQTTASGEQAKRMFLDRIAKGFLGSDSKWIVTKEEFQRALSEQATPKTVRSKTNYLINVLLDQKLVCSGLGNYLLCEIFHKLKISPWARCAEVWSVPRIRDSLFECCKTIVETAYRDHGAQGYQDLFGRAGCFQPEVYDRITCASDASIAVRCNQGPHGRKFYYTDDQVAVQSHTVKNSSKRKTTITAFFEVELKRQMIIDAIQVPPTAASAVLTIQPEDNDPIRKAMKHADLM
jgi:formamidopyrimidine-DNA glycosylase